MVLPSPPTTFLGRAAELDRLRAMFASSARLVTLFGAGGIGKTRLALRYAELHGPDVTTFCDLTNAITPDDVCHVVERELGVELSLDESTATLSRIGDALAARPGLLCVFDNCENATAAVARAVTAWREAASRVRFLVTSRELLGAEGEVAFAVGPLGLPSPDTIREAEAVRLFVDRACLARYDYSLTENDAATVATLVEKLDGIPLAIELAASRLDLLSPSEVLQRLGADIDVLASSAREAPDRQRTMRATIEWSWRSLTVHEKSMLVQLAAFRGSFSLAAAESVVDPGPGRSPPILDLLRSLRAKSLVRALAAEGDQPVRFALYEVIRTFLSETSTTHDHAAARARHLAYFHALAARTLDSRARDVTRRFRTLDLELDNLVVAHERALAAEPPKRDAALTVSVSLERGLRMRGALPMLSHLLRAALAAGPGEDGGIFARAVVANARVLRGVGRVEQSRPDLELARRAAVASGNRVAEAHVLSELAFGAAYENASSVARENFGEALSLLRTSDDLAAEAWTLINLASVELMLQRWSEARAHLERALVCAEECGDVSHEALASAHLGRAFYAEGDLESARTLCGRACDLARRRRLRALVTALGRARLSQSSSLLSLDALLSAVWPNERGSRDALANRVRVAIATLRTLGLREVLRSEVGGYGLSEDVVVVFSD